MGSSDVELVLPPDEELETANEKIGKTHGKNKKGEKEKKKTNVIKASQEELQYRKRNFSEDNLGNEKLSCTSCGKDLKAYLSLPSLISSHPFLDVLSCKSCAEFYGEGEFSVDEDGTDKYCRWCGQGGTLYLCSECNFGFCRSCIKRNLHRSILKDVEADDWKCFSCNPKPLWDLRGLCATALEYVKKKRKARSKNDKKSLKNRSARKEIYSSSESEEQDTGLKKKRKVRESSSEPSEKRKRKKNGNSSEETREVKKKKTKSKESEKDYKLKKKYRKSLDIETTLDVENAETLVSKCGEPVEDLLKVLRTILTEVEKVSKEDIVAENMLSYEMRNKIIEKMDMLKEMSCQSISQACENFVLAYKSGILKCRDDIEVKKATSVSEDLSNVAVHEPAEDKTEDQDDHRSEDSTEQKKCKNNKSDVASVNKNALSETDEESLTNISKNKGHDDSEPENSKEESNEISKKKSSEHFNKESSENSSKSSKKYEEDDSETHNKTKKREKFKKSTLDDSETSDGDQQQECASKHSDDAMDKRDDMEFFRSIKRTQCDRSDEHANCRKLEKEKSESEVNCEGNPSSTSLEHTKDGSQEDTHLHNNQKPSQSEKVSEDGQSSDVSDLCSEGTVNGKEETEYDKLLGNVSGNTGKSDKTEKMSLHVDELSKLCTSSEEKEEKSDTQCSKENEENSNQHSNGKEKSPVVDANESVSNIESSEKVSKEKIIEESASDQSASDVHSDNEKQCGKKSNSKSEISDKSDKKQGNNTSETRELVNHKKAFSDSDSCDDVDGKQSSKISDNEEKEPRNTLAAVDGTSHSNVFSDSDDTCDEAVTKQKKGKSDNNEEKTRGTLSEVDGKSHNHVLSESEDVISDSESERKRKKKSEKSVTKSYVSEEENMDLLMSNNDTDVEEQHQKESETSRKKSDSSTGTEQIEGTEGDSHKLTGSDNGEDTKVSDTENSEIIQERNEQKRSVKKMGENEETVISGEIINDSCQNELTNDSDESKSEKLSSSLLSVSKSVKKKTAELKKKKSLEDSVSTSDEDNKKALMTLLASSSSDDDSIRIRTKKKLPDGEKTEKCGPLSSKSESYRNSVKRNRERNGVFSDASEEKGEHSENREMSNIVCYSENSEVSESVPFRKCSVVLRKLPEKLFKKYNNDSCFSEEDRTKKSEKEEIKKLIDLRCLEATTKKKTPSVDSDTDSDQETNVKKKKVFRKHAKKKEKQTLKDFHNSDDEHSSQSNHSEDSNKKDSKNDTGLKGLLEQLNKKRNKMAEELLLKSSSSDSDEIIFKRDKEDKKKKNEKKVKVKEEPDECKKKEKSSEKEETDESDEETMKKKKWRNDKLLSMKLSETDTSDEDRKWKKKKEREAEQEEKARKKPVARRIMNSDSDVACLSVTSESDSDDDFKPVKRKRKANTDSDKSEKKGSDSDSDASVKKKPKRRRIRKPVPDSSDDGADDDDDDDDDDDGAPNSQKSDNTPSKGRKNIRRVMKDDNVAEATRRAAKEEEDRLKRITEKQLLYNSLYNLAQTEAVTVDKLVLDFDPETKKELIQVDSTLVTKLKPHQVKGVKFMWDACFESLERIQKSEGSGCILAHCMGLGKTLQVITLSHTILNHRKTKVKTILVVCPLSTVLNWVNEFSKWLDQTDDNDIEVLELTKYKQMYERVGVLKHWHEKGGVMIIGYNLYRTLTNEKMKKQRKTTLVTLQKTLVEPGPDLVICDEGHLLKNEGSALSKAMNRLKTQRRIVLTGTPLQNNLLEYHCMVQFVKPNLLGTKKEFTNRFVNPINNGQYDNSTAHDVKVMKRRAHVLHKMLDSSVQRFDYSVLTPFLPPKFEYALSIRLTELQVKLYKHYLENISFVGCTKNKTARLFSDFQALQRVWTHPRVLLMNSEKVERKRILEDTDSEGSLRDFVVSTTSESSSSSSSDSDSEKKSGSENGETKKRVHKRKTRSGVNCDNDSDSVKSVKPDGEDEKNSIDKEDKNGPEWWRQFLTDESQLDDIKQSGKLSLLFTILEECEKIGDKVLVFSQSLFSLDLIEYFLQKMDEADQKDQENEELEGHKSSWAIGLDYFRLDGSSSPENRAAWCKAFNREENFRARLFLISTRAGGLGINLVAANRVILFDASWNPSHDVQSIFRVYRFGQTKPCYIYRFLAQHTMEEKVYSRQITKLSLACRVVDEQQIERHYSMDDLQELYNFNPEGNSSQETPLVPKDVLLAELVKTKDSWINTYQEHDTLLENKEEEELNEEERKAAWEDYEKEKQGLRQSVVQYDNSAVIAYLNQFGYTEHQIRDSIVRENPNLTEPQIQYQVSRVLRQILDYVTAEEYRKQVQMQYNKGSVQQPVYYQTPQTQNMVQMQSQIQSQMESQMRLQMQSQRQQRNSQQYVPIMPKQQTITVQKEGVQPQNQAQNRLQTLLQEQHSSSNQNSDSQPGTSMGTDGGQHRIKVKSFGLMHNSNFGSQQVVTNPFAAKRPTSVTNPFAGKPPTIGQGNLPTVSTLASDENTGGNNPQQAKKKNTMPDVIDLDH